MVHRGTRQGLRLLPGVIAPKPQAGQAIEQIRGIGLAALAQVMPKALGLIAGHGAQLGQLRVRAVVAGHRDQLHAPCAQLDQLLDTIAPVPDATMQGQQDHLGMAQHLIDVQVDRGVILHLHGVGQSQAGEILRQLLGGFGEQRQCESPLQRITSSAGVWPRSAMLSSGTKPPGWVRSRCMGQAPKAWRRRASSAAASSAWPISTRRVIRGSSARQARSKCLSKRVPTLDQQAHRLAGDGSEALGAQDAEFDHQLSQGIEQQAFVRFWQVDGNGVEGIVVVIVMIIALVVCVMVGTATIDVRLGLGAYAQQHLQRQAAAAGLDHLDRRRQFFADFGTHLGQALGIDQISLVQHHRSALASWSANSSCRGDS